MVPRIGTNTNVYYVNERAVVECVMRIPNTVFWFLNDESPPRLPKEPYRARVNQIWYRPHNITSNLVIDASPETNNTRILCQAVNRDEWYNSPTIVLSVQGKQQCL